MTAQDPQEIYRAKLNLETSRIAWRELQRFFASGSALFVSSDLDMIEVALQFSLDNKAQVERWLLMKKVGKVTDAQALAWNDAGTEVWAVVVSPWVLVQAV